MEIERIVTRAKKAITLSNDYLRIGEKGGFNQSPKVQKWLPNAHRQAGKDKSLFPHLNNKLPIALALSIIVPEDKCWRREEKKQSLCREPSTERNIYDQSFASKCHRLRTGKKAS